MNIFSCGSIIHLCVPLRGWVSRCVNLAHNPWVSPDPLFIKPLFRGAPNEGAKKKP